MRILFTGAAPWVNSGYGKPYRYLIPALTEVGHDCALACFFGFRGATRETTVEGAPVRLYSMARASYFNDIIEFHAASWEADLVISFQDVWTLESWGEKPITWCPRFPIDTEPVSKPILQAIEGCHTPLALSRWGQQELVKHGWPHAAYIPLAVDLDVHCPQDQAAAREAVGLPTEGLIVGMVAANSSSPSRKSFPEVLQAWKRWREGGGEGVLYLHTTLSPKREHGVDFPNALATLGLDWSTIDDPNEARRARASVLFPCQHKMWCGSYDDEHLARFYNAFDVLFNPSMSEGFGLPIIEAQACGTPVVTLNVTSMPELTFSGLCLEPVQPVWNAQGGWRGVAPIDGLLEAIGWADDVLRSPTGAEHYSERAYGSVSEFGFDAAIKRYWVPFLQEMKEEIDGRG